MDECEHKINNGLRSKNAREQAVIDCRNNAAYTHGKFKPNYSRNVNVTMDARSILNPEAVDSSAEIAELIRRWKISRAQQLPNDRRILETISRA